MEITVAKHAGFCPGVKNAVDTVKKLVENRKANQSIYTLGKLIHNSRVTESLEKCGVRVISDKDIDMLYEGASEQNEVIIAVRAHGIPKDISEKLTKYSNNNKHFIVYDCTCRYVKKIHSIVQRETADSSALLVIGDISHPEVGSIVSYAASDVTVASGADDIDLCNLHNKSLIMVAQTTQNLSEWQKSQDFIKKHCTNAKIFDTICSMTEDRQNEARKLAASVDLMYIIGSRDSSNTNKLLAVSRSVLPNSHMIEDASELDFNLIKKAKTIGITAGASTPGDIIEEVKTTMSETISSNNETFEKMLEDSLKTLNTGDIVTGVITSISSTEIHVDLSANVTGILPISEIVLGASEKVEDKYKVGEEITAFVTRVSDIEGVAGLSRKRIERIEDWQSVVAAKESGEILEGKVTDAVKGGIMVLYKTVKIFIPASQTGVGKDTDLATLTGNTVKFIVIDVESNRNRAVASIKSVLRKERKEAAARLWETLEVGQKFKGTVKSIASFGAFVDIGGVDGLVHIGELSWKHIKTPAEVVSVGDVIDVYVKSFDPEKKKISLGYKTEETNPWNLFTAAHSEGDVVSVTVVNITPFGAFAEIEPEVDGLIHISQIADRKLGSPNEVLHVGDVVNAKITSIDYEKKKVSLSVRALLAPANDETENAEEDVSEGEADNSANAGDVDEASVKSDEGGEAPINGEENDATSQNAENASTANTEE